MQPMSVAARRCWRLPVLVMMIFCRVLIAAGANLKAKDNEGKTALKLAVQNNHDDVVRVLKEAGETE